MRLLDALQEASEEDLHVLDEQIAALRDKISTLQIAQKLIAVRLGVAPKTGAAAHRKSQKKSVPEEKGAEASPEDEAVTNKDRQRQLVYRYIMANGPSKLADLAKGCGIPMGSMNAVVDHAWFFRTAKGLVDLRDR